MTRPGGIIVYATCSLQPEEGPARIAALLDAGAPVERVAITAAEVAGLAELLTPLGELRSLPCHLAELGGLDGFYAARLRRASQN
jgi:16S rRNA (cytosine967-C5)-methyltransferase